MFYTITHTHSCEMEGNDGPHNNNADRFVLLIFVFCCRFVETIDSISFFCVPNRGKHTHEHPCDFCCTLCLPLHKHRIRHTFIRHKREYIISHKANECISQCDGMTNQREMRQKKKNERRRGNKKNVFSFVYLNWRQAIPHANGMNEIHFNIYARRMEFPFFHT